MSKSPYTYTSLDTDLVTMAKDLENLGGGAARIEDSEVYVIIDDKIEIASRNDYSILKPLGTQIGLQDSASLPANKKHIPLSQAMKYYDVKGSAFMSEMMNAPGYIPPVE